VVVGIFKVASAMEHLDDLAWGPSCTYKIIPENLPPPGKVLDFKKLLQNPRTRFDLFPNRKKWAAYLRGHACRLLSHRDFEAIKEAIQNPEFLIPTPEIRPP
jgi:hypothetical protein